MKTKNWNKVNQKYVNEGYLYLSFEFLKTWKSELKALNKNKEGARFQYPDSQIRFCSVLKTTFGVGLRQIQGMMRGLQQWIPVPAIPDYTTISRRFNKLGLDLVQSLANPVDGQVIAVDSTGVKLYNSGQWIREKHKQRKPFLKLHVAVNVHTKQAVATIVTEDSVGDNAVVEELVKQAQNYAPIQTFLGDGAYDKRELWRDCSNSSIKLVIKLRRNASESGLSERARQVRLRNQIGQDEWNKQNEYGKRWLSEIWYSSFKRRFGEYTSARKPENIKQELLFKAILCNQLIA